MILLILRAFYKDSSGHMSDKKGIELMEIIHSNSVLECFFKLVFSHLSKTLIQVCLNKIAGFILYDQYQINKTLSLRRHNLMLSHKEEFKKGMLNLCFLPAGAL